MSSCDESTQAALRKTQLILDAIFPGHLVILVVGGPLEDPSEWQLYTTRNCDETEAHRVLTRVIAGLTEEEDVHVEH